MLFSISFAIISRHWNDLTDKNETKQSYKLDGLDSRFTSLLQTLFTMKSVICLVSLFAVACKLHFLSFFFYIFGTALFTFKHAILTKRYWNKNLMLMNIFIKIFSIRFLLLLYNFSFPKYHYHFYMYYIFQVFFNHFFIFVLHKDYYDFKI